MPAPKKFTEEKLRMTALAIVDDEGLPALTMRRLAEVLGTGAMTAYNYVDGRDGLEALIVGAVMAEVSLPGKPAKGWEDDVRTIATALWRTVRRHPNVIPLIINRRTDDPATLAWAEVLLEASAGCVSRSFGLHRRLRPIGGRGLAEALAGRIEGHPRPAGRRLTRPSRKARRDRLGRRSGRSGTGIQSRVGHHPRRAG